MVAIIQKPAPTFKTEAVADGLFKELSLSDFLGQWCVYVGVYVVAALFLPSAVSSKGCPFLLPDVCILPLLLLLCRGSPSTRVF